MSMLPIEPGQPGYRMEPMFDPSLMQMGQVKKRGGMFGAGGAGRGIAGAIGDYLLQLNGMQPIYAPAMQHQREYQQRQQEYQQQRADSRDDFLWKQDHTAPEPTQTDRYLGEYLDPNTDPQRKAALGQVLFPPVMGVVNGVPSMIDRTALLGANRGGPQPGQVEDGFRFKGGNPSDPNAWEPANGGPTAPPSGGFPRPY